MTTQSLEQALAAVEQIQAQDEEVQMEAPPTRHPVDGQVHLVGGLVELTGLVDTATVRELNGRDEETISKSPNVAKAMITILNLGIETIGGKVPDQDAIDSLLAADRDLLLMKIREITFGAELESVMACPFCNEESEITLDLSEDIPVTYLEDPIRDRNFTVPLRNGGVAEVRLPTGITQKNLASAVGNKTVAELNTLMLYGCIRTINGRDVLDVSQILSMGIADRNAIAEELTKRTPGPQWTDVTKECPNCGEEVPLPLSADALFRL
jgi:hypothetical protein